MYRPVAALPREAAWARAHCPDLSRPGQSTHREAVAAAVPGCYKAHVNFAWADFVAEAASAVQQDIAVAPGTAARRDIAVEMGIARDIERAAAGPETARLECQPADAAVRCLNHCRTGPGPAKRQAPRRSRPRLRRFEP